MHVESATISSTITKERGILEGSASSLGVNVSSELQDINNVESDFDGPEHEASTGTLDLRLSVSQARRFEGRYLSSSIPSITSPNK